MISGPIDRITRLDVKRLDTGESLSMGGREAWCLAHLLQCGERGVTPLERPAPRWSDYVHKLRKRGLPVETVDEKHGGVYAGSHARYVLRAPVEVIEQEFAA